MHAVAQPGRFDGPGVDIGQHSAFTGEDRPEGITDGIRLPHRDDGYPVAVSDNNVAGLDYETPDRDRHVAITSMSPSRTSCSAR